MAQKTANAAKLLIERALRELADNGIPAAMLRDQISSRNLGPSGNTGSGYTPDPDAVTRVQVRLDSAGSTYERRRLNLIAGSGITITFADDSGNEEIDITFTASGGGGGGAYVVAEDGTIVLDEDGNPVTSE